MNELPLILQLDANTGLPLCWIDYEESSKFYCKGLIAWTMNAQDFTLRGGTNAATGQRSSLTMETIIAVKGKSNQKATSRSFTMNKVPLTNKTLFKRDKHICAYCGIQYGTNDLSRDHVIPVSKGGPNVWMNVVTSCCSCNLLKDDRTPQEANMPLLYAPYIPSRAEYLILQNRKILGDQLEFLLAKVPKESRLHS